MDVKQENIMADEEWSTIVPQQTEEEKIEIEIEGQETEQEEPIQIEKEEPVQAQQEKKQEKSTEEEQALEGVETSGAQKRIRQLVSQKKEREAEIEKLIEQNKEMQLKLHQRDEAYKNALSNNLDSSEKQIEERLIVAKDSYKRAVESGDADLILQAQQYLNAAQIDSSRLDDAKKQFALNNPEPQQQQEQQPQQPEVQPDTYMGYDMKAYQWASQNEWFNSDQILTSAALVIDQQLKEEGFDPKEDEFYEEVDKRLAAAFPHKFSGNTETPVPQETSTPAQVVAGASLAPKASSGKKVKLTQEDVRLANKWGISLEQYAQEKLKIERAGDGGYTNIG